jgi:hypothetical protein
VDTANRSGQFMPQAGPKNGLPSVWLNDGVLAYPGGGLSETGTVSVDNGGLVYSILNVPHYAAVVPTDQDVLASPDGQWWATTATPPGEEQTLFVAPSPGPDFHYRLQAVHGNNPAWSADSRYLAFALNDPNSASLVIFDVAAQDKRTIFTTDQPGAPHSGPHSELQAAWSPLGDRLGLTAFSFTGNTFVGWAATLAPDGSAFNLLPMARADLAPVSLAYSADGKFLAMDMLNTGRLRGVAVYSADGTLRRWLLGDRVAGWSPTGHVLALATPGGVALLREPGAAEAALQPLGPAGCDGVAWRKT